jgi:hypothetical protein
MMENPRNFLYANIFTFIQKLLPPMQMNYTKIFQFMDISSDPEQE